MDATTTPSSSAPPGREDRPPITIMMAIRNEAASIVENLEALLEQDYPADSTEVIVVDGDSDDGTAELVQGFIDAHPDRRILLLHNPDRIVPISLNMALRESTGEIIVRMDGHARMYPDYVSESVRAILEHGADVVGGPLDTIGVTPFGRALAFAQSSPAGIGNSQFRYSQRAAEVPTVGFGTFRREAFERVGLYDETLVRNQDYELNVRIRSTGGTIYLDPAIRAWYTARSSPKGLWRQYFNYGWWRVETLRRHPQSARPNHVLPFALVAGLVFPVPFLRARIIRWAWTSLVATYGSFVLVGGLSQLRRGARLRDVPSILMAIVFMQCGYGSGTLVNLVTGGRWPHRASVARVPRLPARPVDAHRSASSQSVTQ